MCTYSNSTQMCTFMPALRDTYMKNTHTAECRYNAASHMKTPRPAHKHKWNTAAKYEHAAAASCPALTGEP